VHINPDCKLLTTATAWLTVEGQSSRKYQMGSVKERFPREATSIEIWWSRLVDGKEPVCHDAGEYHSPRCAAWMKTTVVFHAWYRELITYHYAHPGQQVRSEKSPSMHNCAVLPKIPWSQRAMSSTPLLLMLADFWQFKKLENSPKNISSPKQD